MHKNRSITGVVADAGSNKRSTLPCNLILYCICAAHGNEKENEETMELTGEYIKKRILPEGKKGYGVVAMDLAGACLFIVSSALVKINPKAPMETIDEAVKKMAISAPYRAVDINLNQ